MKSIRTALIATSLLTSLSGLTWAQNASSPDTASASPRAERMKTLHTQMGERHAQGLTELKSQLKLQASQEDAWAQFVQSMAKPEHAARPDRARMASMNTPERLERLQAMQVERDAHMKKRIAGTQAFYGVLNAEQKQVFDKATAKLMGRMGHQGHKEKGMHRMKHSGGHHGMH